MTTVKYSSTGARLYVKFNDIATARACTYDPVRDKVYAVGEVSNGTTDFLTVKY